MNPPDNFRGQCVCGCNGIEDNCTGLDLGPVRMSFDFTVPEATMLKALVEIGLHALREKRIRLAAMEPSWTIGADDLRMLRENTERQIEEGHDLMKRFLLHPAAELLTSPKNSH